MKISLTNLFSRVFSACSSPVSEVESLSGFLKSNGRLASDEKSASEETLSTIFWSSFCFTVISRTYLC